MKKFIGILFFIIVISCFSVNAFAEDNVYVASFDGEVPLYISPSSDSHVIISMPACSKVKKLEEKQTWVLVEYDGKAGWVNSCFIKPDYKNAAEVTGVDSEKFLQAESDSNVVRLYDLPYNKAIPSDAESFVVPNGTVLEQKRETTSGWGLVTVEEEYMWIKLENTIEYHVYDNVVVEKKYFVYALSSDGNGIKMWKSPQKKVVNTVIPDCARLAVMEKSGEMMRVTYNGNEGWIESSDTEISLYNSQMRAGTEDKKTCRIKSDDANPVEMFSAPGIGTSQGEGVEGTIDNDTAVFVLRQTPSGWSLIYHKGDTGWVKSDCLEKITVDESNDITMLENSKVGFVATKQSKGLDICAKADGTEKIAHIPEVAKIEIIAENGNYKYVISDHASGWAKNVRVVSTRDEATKTNLLSTPKPYEVEKDSPLMSLPADKTVAGSRNLTVVKKGESVTIKRVVETEKCEWALIEYIGDTGWIKIKEPLNVMVVVAIVLSSLGVIVLIVVFILMRKKKITVRAVFSKLFRRSKKEDVVSEEETAEKEDIYNEETADASVK